MKLLMNNQIEKYLHDEPTAQFKSLHFLASKTDSFRLKKPFLSRKNTIYSKNKKNCWVVRWAHDSDCVYENPAKGLSALT